MSYKLAGVIWNDDGTMETKKPSPLKSLERIRKNLTRYTDIDDEPYLFQQDESDLDIIEKSLKALEIIKEKGVNLYKLKMFDSVEEYNKLCNSALPLTQEEFNSLKEELK